VVSFRFHLVSLVAVFLALGLGVLTGTTVLNRGIVAQLDRRTDQLAEQSSRLREQVLELQAETDTWARFGTEVLGFAVPGRLTGQEIVVVTQEGTDTQAIDGVRRSLQTAGAEIVAVLSIDPSMALEDKSDVEELRRLVGSVQTDPAGLAEEAASALASRLVAGPGGADLLDGLLRSGFLLNRGPGLGAPALREVGRPGQAFVMVAGATGEPILEPERFLVPLARDIAVAGGLVAAAEVTHTDYPFVTLLRGEAATSRLIVTQDNIDRLPGEVGFVLALEDLIEDSRPGHYGVKDGADAVIPPLA